MIARAWFVLALLLCGCQRQPAPTQDAPVEVVSRRAVEVGETLFVVGDDSITRVVAFARQYKYLRASVAFDSGALVVHLVPPRDAAGNTDAQDTTRSFPMTDTTYISDGDTIFIGDGLRIAVTRDTISDAELMFMLVQP